MVVDSSLLLCIQGKVVLSKLQMLTTAALGIAWPQYDDNIHGVWHFSVCLYRLDFATINVCI